MKFKTLLGAMVALGTIMLASVTAHAATYEAATVNGTAGQRVVVPVTVAPSGSADTVNGYIFDVTYDKDSVDIVQPSEHATEFPDLSATFTAAGDEFAAPAGICAENGVFVGGKVDAGHAVFAWANASALDIDAKQNIAYLVFDVPATAADDIDITIAIKQLSVDGTSANDTATANDGKIKFGSAGYLLGDPTLDGLINVNDVNAMKLHILGTKILVGDAFSAGDMDLSGVINVNDVNLIKKLILEKE